MDPLHVALVAFPLLGLAIGFLLGRRTGEGSERARLLEAELDAQRTALEQVQAEKQAVLDDLGRARAEAGGYRERVVQHFYGTSDQLRSLTLRYRELFEHLAEGARELCPEAAGALEAGLETPALGGGGGAAELEVDADAAVPASAVQTAPGAPEGEASEAPAETATAPPVADPEVSKAPGQTPY